MDEAERRLRQANLNLLVVLRAVLKHRNLTRAAQDLNLTQPGVSNALRRLRETFADELLIQDGRNLRLTERAQALVEPLDRILAGVQNLLADDAFDPARSTRQFRIATADYVTAITTPALADILSREAPSVRFQLVTAKGRSVEDLRVENIDMVISPRQVMRAGLFDAPKIMREFSFEPLIREPFVCLGRRGDPDIAKGLTREAYLARAHAGFHLDLDVHASLEQAYLQEHGVIQFDRILTSDFSVLPLIAARSDCLVLVPRSLGRLAAEGLAVEIGPCPLPVPDLELMMIWRKRLDDDPEIAWARQVLRRCVAGIGDEPP